MTKKITLGEKERENWLKLYEIAEKINEIEPWKELWDTDLFVYVENEDIKNSLYFCTMGKGGVHKSIAVYKGEQIDGYLEMLNSQIDGVMSINYQECLKVCYLSKEETIDENQNLIKELGLKYTDTWTSFEKFESGYGFGQISDDDVVSMIKALENYYEMFVKYKQEKLKIDFEKSKGLIRKYNTKTGIVNDVVERIIFVGKKFDIIELNDKDLKDLKNSKKSNMELEIEFLNHLPIFINDCKDDNGRYTYPLFFAIAEKNSQFILDMNLTKKDDNFEKYMQDSLNRLIKFMKNYGIPKKIYVRDIKTLSALKDLTEKLNIDITLSSSLPALDYAYEMILNPPADFNK